jgi:hypothetical protein
VLANVRARGGQRRFFALQASLRVRISTERPYCYRLHNLLRERGRRCMQLGIPTSLKCTGYTLVLFGLQIRIFVPFSLASHRILFPVMRYVTQVQLYSYKVCVHKRSIRSHKNSNCLTATINKRHDVKTILVAATGKPEKDSSQIDRIKLNLAVYMNS